MNKNQGWIVLLAGCALLAAGCGSNNGGSTMAESDAKANGAVADDSQVTSPGKPMPNAAFVRIERAEVAGNTRQLGIVVEPRAGVQLMEISFPGKSHVTSFREHVPLDVAGKLKRSHTFDLEVQPVKGQSEVVALLRMEADGKRFGQLVRIPLEPGEVQSVPAPVAPEEIDPDGQTYQVSDMPAEQEVIRD